MKENKIQTKTMTEVALFTAVLIVLAQISIPLPTGVPITLQTFAVALTGIVLGWKMAGITVLVYMILGMAGMPVFAGMKAGMAVLFGATGGFLIGFIGMAIFCGLAAQSKSRRTQIFYCICGLIVCHLIGVLQFSILMQVSIVKSFLMVSAPFLIKDLLSVAIAFEVGSLIKRRLSLFEIL